MKSVICWIIQVSCWKLQWNAEGRQPACKGQKSNDTVAYRNKGVSMWRKNPTLSSHVARKAAKATKAQDTLRHKGHSVALTSLSQRKKKAMTNHKHTCLFIFRPEEQTFTVCYRMAFSTLHRTLGPVTQTQIKGKLPDRHRRGAVIFAIVIQGRQQRPVGNCWIRGRLHATAIELQKLIDCCFMCLAGHPAPKAVWTAVWSKALHRHR